MYVPLEGVVRNDGRSFAGFTEISIITRSEVSGEP